MDLKGHLKNIESICSSCETCNPSCAANMFKSCLKSELEIEEAFQYLNNETIRAGSTDNIAQPILF